MGEKQFIIDFHSHILPGMDHGSYSLHMSLKQVSLMAAHGVDVAVATPHFYPNEHKIKDYLEQRKISEQRLLEAMEGKAPRIISGAEILICEGLDRMSGLEKLCIGDTNYIMLEMPLKAWNSSLFDTIRNIKKLGIVPILAHIDRFLKNDIDSLLELDVPAQINVDSVLNGMKRKRIVRMIEDGFVVALGSDLHEVSKSTYSKFDRGLRKLGPDTAKIMDKSKEILGITELLPNKN